MTGIVLSRLVTQPVTANWGRIRSHILLYVFFNLKRARSEARNMKRVPFRNAATRFNVTTSVPELIDTIIRYVWIISTLHVLGFIRESRLSSTTLYLSNILRYSIIIKPHKANLDFI